MLQTLTPKHTAICTTRMTTWHQTYTSKWASHCVWTTSSQYVLLLTLLQGNMLIKEGSYIRCKLLQLAAGSCAPKKQCTSTKPTQNPNGTLQSHELISACQYTSCILSVAHLATKLTHVLTHYHGSKQLSLRWPSLWLALDKQADLWLECLSTEADQQSIVALCQMWCGVFCLSEGCHKHTSD